MTARPWRQAWEDALYGPEGFYRKGPGPRAHFRTASHASAAALAAALTALARRCGCAAVVDVGAGRGELLTAIATTDPSLSLAAVELAARPDDLPAEIAWHERLSGHLENTLLIGWELLDVVPCDVLEVDGDGTARQVLVDEQGRERLGPPATSAQLDWCRRWWPVDDTPPGTRVEVGAARDEAWVEVVSHLRSGLAVAVDYGHDLAHRPSSGTLTGFRGGRQAPPALDGSTDVTAHVALDSVAVALDDAFPAGLAPRVTASLDQRRALTTLGVTGRRPPLELASTDPLGYLRRLRAAGEAAELVDSGGLGGFGWVLHAVGPLACDGVRDLVDGDSTGGDSTGTARG